MKEDSQPFEGPRPSGRGPSWMQGGAPVPLWSCAAGLVLLVALLPPVVGNYWTQILGDIGIYIMLGIGLNVVVGFAGLLDLGYVAFYAIGAYGYALAASPQEPSRFRSGESAKARLFMEPACRASSCSPPRSSAARR